MSNSYCCRFVVAATAAFSPFPRTIYLFLNAITCGSSAAMANEKGGVVRRKVGVWRRWRGSFPPQQHTHDVDISKTASVQAKI